MLERIKEIKENLSRRILAYLVYRTMYKYMKRSFKAAINEALDKWIK